MARAQTPEPMTADAASRLVEFARSCKAAIRIVSMYPPSHPNIQSALDRMTAAGVAATSNGPMSLGVMPEALMMGGRTLPKPDPSVNELAVLLHGHHIGELTLQAPLTPGGWHMLLSLLATSPEEIRLEGGITRAWQSAGGGPVEILEIDYAEVLKERAGDGDSSWNALIDSCLVGDLRSALDEKALASLLEIARDPDRLGEFMNRLQERARATGQSTEVQKQAVLRLLKNLAVYALQHSPDDFDEVMTNVATATTRLNADVMLALLAEPPPKAGASGRVEDGIDIGGELRSRFNEEQLGAFVAENVSRDRGATGRLAEAFNALAGSDDQRRTALLLAEERVSLTPLGNDPQFNEIWADTVSMLMSYSDADYVPDEYDRELTSAREMAIEVEQVSDDPPDRIAAWLSTVNDNDLRALDQQMLVDLLRLEDRPEAWASVLELALARLEQLVLVGDLALARELLGAVSGVADTPESPFAAPASAAVARLTAGPLVNHLLLFMRQAADDQMPALNGFCQELGPGLIVPLVSALAKEDSRLAVRRVKDLLIGFGEAAREPAKALRDSSNPAVRRAAIEVLRAVGGAGALGDLRSLLADTDPNVQREALRAIIQIGSDEAYAVLEEALTSGEPREREAVMHTLGSITDERAAPLLVHILSHSSHKGASESIYISAIDALGRSGASTRGVETLKDLLHRGEWWAPMRTARIRAAAARALRAAGSAAADAVLEDASTTGSRGVRRAAADAMLLPRRSPPAGGTR
jgi:hypothetical protein